MKFVKMNLIFDIYNKKKILIIIVRVISRVKYLTFLCKKQLDIMLLLFLLLSMLNLKAIESINNKISLVIPIAPRDPEKIIFNLKFYKKYIIGINNFIFIGNKEVDKLIKKQNFFF